MTVADSSRGDLLLRLALLRARVVKAVADRRSVDDTPDDPFRGLYVSDEAISRLLESATSRPNPDVDGAFGRTFDAALDDIDASANAAEAEGKIIRLRRLALIFGLDAKDLELLVIAMAPDLDAHFEQFYGYLHDDVSRRRASVGLALELSGLDPTDGDARMRLSPHGTLISAGLLVIDDADRPVLTRSLRVPDRITAHVLGADVVDPSLLDVVDSTNLLAAVGRSAALERSLQQGLWPVYVHEAGVASGVATAVSSVAELGGTTLVVDLSRLAKRDMRDELVNWAIREALLMGAVLVASNLDDVAEQWAAGIDRFATASCPTILVGKTSWDPRWSTAVPVVIEAPVPALDERLALLRAALAPGAQDGNGHLHELSDAASAFKLSAPQLMRAARSGHLRALADDRPMKATDVHAGARAQNAAGLERVARRVEPHADWADIVLPLDVSDQLRELAIRGRHREQILDAWGVGGRSSRGRGITALFAGESGTGKTLAAEVIAGQLGLDLYVIDISAVVDKYIGETEKNLDRIFTEADRVNGILLFDEADAIFGKRSEVRDARDRYANIEVAYLLQRMERFDGLAILTTNLRANLDDAFTRRIDVIVDFPMPQEEAREALWRMHLPARLPQAADLDLAFMARRFQLSGGNIRNICMTAAYLAAEDGGGVSMAHLIRATEREYRKLGRLTLEAEFGPYVSLLGAVPIS